MTSPSARRTAEGHMPLSTYDLHRLMEGAVKVKTSEFAAVIVGNMALPAAA